MQKETYENFFLLLGIWLARGRGLPAAVHSAVEHCGLHFHRINPLGRFGLVVAMSMCLSVCLCVVPFACIFLCGPGQSVRRPWSGVEHTSKLPTHHQIFGLFLSLLQNHLLHLHLGCLLVPGHLNPDGMDVVWVLLQSWQELYELKLLEDFFTMLDGAV